MFKRYYMEDVEMFIYCYDEGTVTEYFGSVCVLTNETGMNRVEFIEEFKNAIMNQANEIEESWDKVVVYSLTFPDGMQLYKLDR